MTNTVHLVGPCPPRVAQTPVSAAPGFVSALAFPGKVNRIGCMTWRALFIILTTAVAVLGQGGPPPGGPGGGGDGIWRRNAYYGELLTFDACVGHQPGTGMYHY